MRSKNRQYMIDRRNAHHDVQDRQVHTTENGSKKIDPKASQRKMQTAKNNEEQRNYMNHFHNTNLTLSEDYPHLQCSTTMAKNPQESWLQRTIGVSCSIDKMLHVWCDARG
jgi:hypothetical protein